MVEKWKSEVGKEEKQNQGLGPRQAHRDMTVEARLLNTEKFLEKHLMDNLMWYICDSDISDAYLYCIMFLASSEILSLEI